MKRFFYTCFLLAAISGSALKVQAQTTVPLYPGVIPNSLANAVQEEKKVTSGNIEYAKVSRPTLEIYLPKENASGAAIIICPGGGYTFLSYANEGTKIAQAFN
ncbi:MAG: alpha/beta hydrolase, partial [Sphingobacteriaceae bacterium]